MGTRYRLYCVQCHVACADSVLPYEYEQLVKMRNPAALAAVDAFHYSPADPLFTVEPALESVEADSGSIPGNTVRFLMAHRTHRLAIADDHGKLYDVPERRV